MDAHFDSIASHLTTLCASRKTDDAWRLWSSAFETAVLDACDNVEPNPRYRGHGQVRLIMEPPLVCPKALDTGAFHQPSSNILVGHVRKQYNRLSKLKEYLKTFSSSSASGR